MNLCQRLFFLAVLFFLAILCPTAQSAAGDDAEAADDKLTAALTAGLNWLAEKQRDDGGWSFDPHSEGGFGGARCDDDDSAIAPNAATGLVLLAFLNAGHGDAKSPFHKPVDAGLRFLVRNGKSEKEDQLSFAEPVGTMYSHGIATLALCEAFARTRDMTLQEPAQKAVNFIVFAQDPVGGGWRYQPRQPGDTSATGWHVSALYAAQAGMLEVPAPTLRGVVKFLDTVQQDEGACYGYTSPGRGAATTAIGLLCRQHTGWKKDHAALERGVRWLSEKGPSIGDGAANMYYIYYATQVLHNYGGEPWDDWRKPLTDFLIEQQSHKDDLSGSFYLPGDHGAARGGRIYCTAMALMTLATCR